MDIDRFAVATGIAGQWQRAVERLGGQDVTVVTRALQH
jgi:hypothetical protein